MDVLHQEDGQMLKTLQDVFMEERNSDIKTILNSLYIDKISVDKENNIWNVYLNSRIHIENNYIKIIEKMFLNRFGINGDLNLIIKEIDCDNFECLKLSSREEYTNLMGVIFGWSPALCCLLQSSQYKIFDNNLEIFCENEFSYSILIDKKVDEAIKGYIKYNYGISVNVSIKINEIDFEKYEKQKENEDKALISEHINSITNNTTKDNKRSSYNKAGSNTIKIYGKKINKEAVDISSLNEESGIIAICGEIFKVEARETRSGKFILSIFITDYTSSVTVKLFLKPEGYEEIKEKLKAGKYVKVQGEAVNDKYSRELVIMASGIEEAAPVKRLDNAKEKRIELHLHTQMSSMDGISSASELVKRAKDWGHSAIAITDHGVVQAFPEAMEAGKKNGIKIIYGVEGYLVDDGEPIIFENNNQPLCKEFIVFDIETTGLNKSTDKIIEIGAVKIKDYKIIDRFSALINPGCEISKEIIDLTGINNDMVRDMPSIQEVLPEFIKFIGSSPVVAHNANFDTGFIRVNLRKIGLNFKNPIIDTLTLSRWLVPELKRYKLNILTEHFGIKLLNHHRAVDDAEATAQLFLKLLEMIIEKGAETLGDIDTLYSGNFDIKKAKTYHIIILVKNYEGLYNLYKLISFSHLNYFYKKPRIPKSLLKQYKDGLIIGSACEAGQVFKGVLNNLNDDEMANIIKFYDYLEIQPRGNNAFLLEDGTVENEKQLLELNKRIVELGKRYNKLVVATGDVHFLDPHDEYFRRILMAGQGFNDADKQAPLYFKTTDEMLEEFSYLGNDKAYEVVIKNPSKIADMVEMIKPIPDETFPPKIDGAEEEVMDMTLKKAHEIYGENLPEIVQKRLDKELNSIINNGYAVLYLIAHKLVHKSLEDGYLVGSRGSVGSSFVATMCEITEVNPLPPHYVCPNCKNSEFFTDGFFSSGADLPDKKCPLCGADYKKDGNDIFFEVFLGFEGDKEPDIDLNFSGEYQPMAHKYTEEIFGEGHVFRAGTIGTIAEKTAYGFVKNYLDDRKINVTNAEIERLINGCTGIKRTTGQHPGGVMVVPRDKEIFEFSPIQRPADDTASNIITTHFDYHSISGRLLKLDILGHDDPTVIRMLQDLTDVDPIKIPLADEKVLKLFTSTESLGITPEDINCEVGTLGIPEFGTKFVRQMLLDTKPKTFGELLRISGLSHGTDVWLNNAQELIRNGLATLKDVISTRDDIMIYLISKGVKSKTSFTIMERVRKGKGLRDEDIEEMKNHDIPEWYIESCKKIKYLFPRGHAVAYVMMAVRIAYFKVYYPEAFYAIYFTVRADDFDAELILKGENAIKHKIKELESMGNNATQKDKGLLTVLEIAFEMYKRGYKFCPVDLYISDSVKFLITDRGILPPFKALQGIGENAAKNIVKARCDGEFLSKEDLRTRSKISKTAIEIMNNHGCLKGLPDTDQLALF